MPTAKTERIIYRRATLSEVDSLTKIRMDFLREAYGASGDMEIIEGNIKQFMIDSLRDGSFVSWVATKDGEIVATSGISFYALPPNQEVGNGRIAYISNMFTYPEHRKQGIGSRLFEMALEEAKNNGCKKVLLDATALGRPIYEKYGFKDTKDDMVYFVS